MNVIVLYITMDFIELCPNIARDWDRRQNTGLFVQEALTKYLVFATKEGMLVDYYFHFAK